jgi:RHS repeat-associated protein
VRSSAARLTSTLLTLRDACANAFGRIVENTIPPTVTQRLHAYSIYDADTGLYKIGARWYDPVIGVWLTPDSIVPDLNKPIAWNRYAFNYQNPANYVDPSGHIPIWDIVDFAFFVSSLYSFVMAPGVGAGIDLLWDTVDLLPGITALGWGDEMAVLVGGAPRDLYSVERVVELANKYPLVIVNDVDEMSLTEDFIQHVFREAGHQVPSNVAFVVGDAKKLPLLHHADIFVVAPDLKLHDVVDEFGAGWLGDKSRLLVASNFMPEGPVKRTVNHLKASGLNVIRVDPFPKEYRFVTNVGSREGIALTSWHFKNSFNFDLPHNTLIEAIR